jgi:hypothetical protein
MYCPSDNTQAVDQSHFWSSGGPHLDAHRIGWIVAGICALVVRAIFPAKMTRVHLHLTTDCYNLCYNRSTPLSVCHGFNAILLRANVRSNYTNPAEQRQMYVSSHTFLRPSVLTLLYTVSEFCTCLPYIQSFRSSPTDSSEATPTILSSKLVRYILCCLRLTLIPFAVYEVCRSLFIFRRHTALMIT